MFKFKNIKKLINNNNNNSSSFDNQSQKKEDNNSFTEETIYDIIIYLFILVGFLYIWKEKRVPEKYGVIVAFCMFKILTNYRKCTFSRLECKIRGVKKEEGVLASYLDRMVDLRYSKYKYIIYTFYLQKVIFCYIIRMLLI